MLLVLLTACDPVTEPLPPVVCAAEPGRVQWIEGRRDFGALSEALEQDAPWLTLCLGEGDYLVDEDLLELESLGASVQLIGEGPDRTRLVADPELDTGGAPLRWPGRPLALVFEDLELAFPVELAADTVVLDTVDMHDLEVPGGLLRIDAHDIRLRDLHVERCRFGFGGLSFVEDLEDGSVLVNRLRWVDNVATAGLHVFVEGERSVVFRDLHVEDSADVSAGYPMVYGFGEIAVQGGSFYRARVGGPLLSARVLRVQDLSVLEGRSSSGGLVQIAQGLYMERVSFQDSRSPGDLLSAYKGSLFPVEIEILDSQFGTELPNAVTCDLRVAGTCARESFGAVASWSCSYCTEALPN